MAEVQKTVQTGEMTQRFIEFVMMHAQNAALFLGQIPNPKTGEAEINLDLAQDVHRSTRNDSGKNARQPDERRSDGSCATPFPICRWHLWKSLVGRDRSLLAEARTRRTLPHNLNRLRRRPHNRRNNQPQALQSKNRRSHQPSPRRNRGRNSPKATGRSSPQLRRNYCRRAPSALRRSAYDDVTAKWLAAASGGSTPFR